MKPSQREVAINLLRSRGSVGVHTAELRRQYIGNPSQRINDLRDLGYDIDAVKERSPFGQSRGTRYFLRSEPAAAPRPTEPVVVTPDPGPQPSLFDPPAPSPYRDAA